MGAEFWSNSGMPAILAGERGVDNGQQNLGMTAAHALALLGTVRDRDAPVTPSLTGTKGDPTTGGMVTPYANALTAANPSKAPANYNAYGGFVQGGWGQPNDRLHRYTPQEGLLLAGSGPGTTYNPANNPYPANGNGAGGFRPGGTSIPFNGTGPIGAVNTTPITSVGGSNTGATGGTETGDGTVITGATPQPKLTPEEMGKTPVTTPPATTTPPPEPAPWVYGGTTKMADTYPAAQTGESLSEYVTRTAGVTGFPMGQLGAFLFGAYSYPAEVQGDPAKMVDYHLNRMAYMTQAERDAELARQASWESYYNRP